MKRLKEVKENIVNKAVQYKARLEVFFVTLLALFGTSTYAYADISGESIKNNVINGYLVPFCVVSSPDIIKIFGNLIKKLLGIG